MPAPGLVCRDFDAPALCVPGGGGAIYYGVRDFLPLQIYVMAIWEKWTHVIAKIRIALDHEVAKEGFVRSSSELSDLFDALFIRLTNRRFSACGMC